MKFRFLIYAIVLGMALSSPVIAEEEKGSQMDPAMQAMMEDMVKYSTPGENHKVLATMIGQWDHTVKYWMSTESEPEVSTGTSDTQWIMDGRFIQQTVTGEAMGSPFKGLGIIGYDNLTKEYNTIWLDSMSTGIMKANGNYDDMAKTISEKGKFSCPITGGTRHYRAVTTFIDDNHYTYETYTTDENGEEFRSMLITYSRKAS